MADKPRVDLEGLGYLLHELGVLRLAEELENPKTGRLHQDARCSIVDELHQGAFIAATI